MKRATAIIFLALLLLIVGAFLLRRGPREETPRRSPKRPQLIEAPPPDPEPVAAAVLPPKPPPPLPPVKPPDLPPVPEPTPFLEQPGTCIVRGGVRITGTPPERKKVRVDSDPHCEALHPGPMLKDDIVVNAYGGVQWAFVYLKSGLRGQAPPALQLPVLLDQVGCVFTPHVLGVRVGQPFVIRNSDQFLHTAHGMAAQNREFNFGMQALVEETRRFDKREVMLPVKCDIHPWMKAYVGVMDHPFFSVTSDTGSYGIPDLPPGRYVFEVWHEKYVSVSREIDVPAGGDMILDFVLDVKKE